MNAVTQPPIVKPSLALDARSEALLGRPEGRVRFLSTRPEWISTASVTNLTSQVPTLVRSDRGRAMAVAELAMMIAQRLRAPSATAQALRAKANALHAFGRNAEAVIHHRKATRIFRSTGDAAQVARTLSSSIQPLILQG